MRRNIQYFCILIFLFLSDQFTKHFALAYLTYASPVSIIPGINLTLLYNKGVSFGLFNAGTAVYRYGILLLGFSITIGLLYWLWQAIKENQVLKSSALLLIVGGAFGNLYDRIFRGYVVDFVDLYIGQWHWYFFNMADVYICMGAILLFVDIFRKEQAEKKKK